MKIILLDLNYTLVANSRQKKSPFTMQIEHETYRGELLDQLSSYHIILVTARPDRYRDATLASIHDKMGWRPAEAYFNTDDVPPPASKKRALLNFVFPKHGEPHGQYVGVESNPATRRVYQSLGIPSCPWDDPKLTELLGEMQP